MSNIDRGALQESVSSNTVPRATKAPMLDVAKPSIVAFSGDVNRIYLARHGETALNAVGVLRGRLDPVLNETGRRQAELLAGALGLCDFRVVVSSPLRRAVETASVIATRVGLPIQIDDQFIDRDYGPWAGRSKSEVVDRWGSLERAPGVESASSVLSRAMAGLFAASSRASGGAVLVVSHDVVNRLLLHALRNSLDDVDTIPQETGCFNVLVEQEQVWTVLSVNNVPDETGDPTLETRAREVSTAGAKRQVDG